MPLIDYFFTLVSPYAYLGHEALLGIAARHGATIRHRPVRLAGVWAQSGAVPLAERPESRKRYRLIELQRWRARRGVALNLHPAHFPANPSLADRAAAALQEGGHDPAPFMGRVGRAIWAEERDIADPDTLRAILLDLGEEADEVLARAGSEAIGALVGANTEAAVRAGVVGVPGYVLAGEPFWGQDRLDLLDDALATGRAPFTAGSD